MAPMFFSLHPSSSAGRGSSEGRGERGVLPRLVSWLSAAIPWQPSPEYPGSAPADQRVAQAPRLPTQPHPVGSAPHGPVPASVPPTTAPVSSNGLTDIVDPELIRRGSRPLPFQVQRAVATTTPNWDLTADTEVLAGLELDLPDDPAGMFASPPAPASSPAREHAGPPGPAPAATLRRPTPLPPPKPPPRRRAAAPGVPPSGPPARDPRSPVRPPAPLATLPTPLAAQRRNPPQSHWRLASRPADPPPPTVSSDPAPPQMLALVIPPPPPEVAAADPSPRPSLELCATLTARLHMALDESARVLADADLTEARWQEAREHWQQAIDEELQRGQSHRLTSFDEAYVAELEELRGPITSMEYARLERAAERGRMDEECEDLDIPAKGLVRVKRVWVKKICSEPDLRADFIDALECA